VCYKPDMRKWMRERIKRRQKAAEEAKTEAPQAPLQPAFYDTEPTNGAPAVPELQPPPEPSTQPPAEANASGEPAQQHRPQVTNGDAQKRRRRRSRGGRGRRGARSVQAASAGLPAEPVQVPPAEVLGEPVPTPDATTAAPVVNVAPAQPSKGIVVLAIGLPGSGKSAWFKRHNITPLSSDLLRVLLFDDATEQRYQDLIFSNLRSMLKARLIARRPMNYVDATNLTPHERQGWIKLAKDYGYEVRAVFFDVPLETCLERNRKRERIVPEDVMRRMAGKLRQPAFEEGFSKITVVRVKQKD
jgi:predicted kinase